MTVTNIFVDINSIGYITGVAGVDWSIAIQITAAASIGSDLTYVPTNGHL